MRITRRLILLGGTAAGLAACSRKPKAEKAAPPAKPALAPASLEGVVAGAWRSEADKARDRFRHPVESLTFWGLKPGMTVVEFWPGAGWYTDIIAPYLEATKGRFYAAVQQDAVQAAAVLPREPVVGPTSRHQHAHLHAARDGLHERVDGDLVGHEVRVHDVDAAPCRHDRQVVHQARRRGTGVR